MTAPLRTKQLDDQIGKAVEPQREAIEARCRVEPSSCCATSAWEQRANQFNGLEQPLGKFAVGIARKRPRLLRITAPSSNARMICGALV
jgi:hypothetical protein